MPQRVPEQAEPAHDATVEFTIDELAAHTRTPSRTIRFYQSKGALQKPEIRGRKAIYGPEHVERLGLIGTLQDRGLRIKAIRDLVQRIDAGELDLDEWLGLEQRLQARWSDDRPTLYTRAELKDLVGERRGIIADLTRCGLLERRDDSYLASSPALLRAVLDMAEAGIDVDIAHAMVELVRRNVGKLAVDIASHAAKNAGKGFGATSRAGDLGTAFDALRPVGARIVEVVFAREMERVLRDLVESGRVAKVTTKSG